MHLGSTGQPAFKPGPGRRGISYAVQQLAGHLYVVPSDAATLLAQGKLDRRLFDVTALLADGFDDKQSKEIRLLVAYPKSQRSAQLRSINASPSTVTKTQASASWANLVKGQRLAGAASKIWLDGKRKLSLDESVPQIGAPQVWKSGLTGKGTRVAVLDTGIDASHPDLANRVISAENFTEDTPGDHSGHGTHVASTIAGSGTASGGKYRGVAPDAALLDGKVCSWTCFESDILAGMDWAVAQNADVVNLSLGGTDTPELDPLEEAIDRLSSTVLFVVAAGNHPYCTSTRYGVSSPATADRALAVGAVDKADAFAAFSCAGPRIGDHAIKPDITAPGAGIVAARAADGVDGEPVDDHYTRMSGTSMATPHVAGAAAILAQQHPDWSPARLKAALMASSKVHANQTMFQQGAGRVDIAAAANLNVVPVEASVSYPAQLWPHTDDQAVSETITYQNTGTADAELHLAVTGTGPDGKPAGTFTLDRSTLQVPKGGTAQVTVTANTSLDGPDGYYSGRVTATTGTTRLTTALSVEREPESYELTIKNVDRQGRPADGAEVVLASITDPTVVEILHAPTTVVRLPKGQYTIGSFVGLVDADGNRDRVFLAVPDLSLTKDTTLTLDAAQAKPVRVSSPEPGATASAITISYARRGVSSFTYVTSEAFEGLSSAQLGPSAAEGEFGSSLVTHWCKVDEVGVCSATPYEYLLQWFTMGGLYTGLDKSPRREDLAVVKSSYAATSANTLGETNWSARPVGHDWFRAWGFGTWPRLPSEVTLYLQPEGTRWFTQLREVAVDPETGSWSTQTEFGASPRSYRAGSTTRQQWNRGVFGPGFPATDRRPFDPVARPWAARTADQLRTELPLFTDGNGHAGFSPTDRTRTTLKRDGKVLAEATEVAGVLTADLPAGDSQYRLEVEAKRGGLSSEVSAAWTFRSARTSTTTALPLSAIRFSPELDERNRAKAGWIPVRVERQPDSAAKPARGLAVQVSFDDGKVWQPAPLRPTGGGWQVKVSPPPGTAYVSLRAQSTDQAGNSVDQTVVRAFGTLP